MILGDPVDVLLVEDNPAEAELMTRAIKNRNLGNKIVHFLDGYASLDFVSANIWSVHWKPENAPKLILVDLNLADMDGLEVVRQLKVRERTRPIPIVIFTGSELASQILESYNVGANSYVVKPNDSKDYARVVGDIAEYWLKINRSFNTAAQEVSVA
jgi:two-component system response regulator